MNRVVPFLFSLLLVAESLHADIGTFFEREAQYHHFNGVVYISDETQAQQYVFGGSSASKNHAAYTRFNIGSLSKQFTAYAILTLVESGDLQLRQTINQYLGKLSNAKWQDVTVHHLLTHSSGIPSIYQTKQGLPIFFPETSAIELSVLIQRFNSADLLFEPGSEFSYSNSGYVLLAAIIENVSGLPFSNFMQERVFKANGLDSTSFVSDEFSAAPLFGYHPQLSEIAPVNHPSWSIGAGGIYSTVKDLSKWVKAMFSSSFLTPALQEAFLQGHIQIGSGLQYGYGWLHTEGRIQHDGGDTGFMSYISIDKETKNHHIILTNQSYKDIRLFGKSGEKVRAWSDAVIAWRNGEDLKLRAEPTNTIASGILDEIRKHPYLSLELKDGDYLLTSTDPHKIFSSISRHALRQSSPKAEILTDIAGKLGEARYWAMAKHFDWEMKLVTYTGLLWIGLSDILKPIGDVTEFIPYRLDGNRGYIRGAGTKGELDIVVHFNAENKIMGLFDRSVPSLPDIVTVPVYGINESALYIDGWGIGHPSVTLIVENDKANLQQFGRQVPFN